MERSSAPTRDKARVIGIANARFVSKREIKSNRFFFFFRSVSRWIHIEFSCRNYSSLSLSPSLLNSPIEHIGEIFGKRREKDKKREWRRIVASKREREITARDAAEQILALVRSRLYYTA